MKTISAITCLVSLVLSLHAKDMVNPAIRYDQFAELTAKLAPIREQHRVTEADFLRMSSEPETIILDARSKDRYERIHVKGAVHLAFTDFTEEALQKVIPNKKSRILIYCNNNFENEPVNFPSKEATVSLNIQTFVNLHAYGYTNVYELGPLLDIGKTSIPFEGTDVDENGRPSMMRHAPFPIRAQSGNALLPAR